MGPLHVYHPLAHRAHYAARWTRTPSAQLTRVMRDKVQGYRSNLSVAGDSDTR